MEAIEKMELELGEDKEFTARPGARISDEQADTYGRHIMALMKGRDLKLINAEDIVKDAKNPETPYHDHFIWNNKEAGHQYRLLQARNLLNSIVVCKIIDGESLHVREFHSVTINKEQGYTTSEIAFNDEEMSRQIVYRALAEARSWSLRYRAYKELAHIHEAIKEASTQLILVE